MKPIDLTAFKNALQEKNYEALEKELIKMQNRNGPWLKKECPTSLVDCSGNVFAERSYVLLISCSPLFMTVMADDEQACQMVLFYFKETNLFRQTLNESKKIEKLNFGQAWKENPDDCFYDPLRYKNSEIEKLHAWMTKLSYSSAENSS